MESRIAPSVKVLIADAGAAFKRSLSHALAEKGFAITLAGTPEEAFEAARSTGPDVIFYDMDLHGYEGVEALKLLSRMRGAQERYIIASSQHKGDDFVQRALDAGAWDFAARPIEAARVLESALAIKRHLRRPREAPRKPTNRSIKTVLARCVRPGCNGAITGYQVRGKAMVTGEDQFETPLYLRAASGREFADYNLLSVSICPSCYYAFDQAARKVNVPGAPVRAAKAASRPELMRMAAEADDTLLSDQRSHSAALVALRLAVESARAADDGSPESLDELSDLCFKAAVVAHGAGDARLQDRFLGEAEEACVRAVKGDPCAQVYRAAYRLTALYVYFTRDMDVEAMLKVFEGFCKPASGRMMARDTRVLEKYHSAATRLVAAAGRYRRSSYLAES
jgi:CheY-like chemotaxis protein